MALLLEEVFALALQLSPRERLKLASRVITTVEPAERNESSTADQEDTLPWGERVNALLDQLDLSAWQAPQFDDPAEWVRNLRAAQDK